MRVFRNLVLGLVAAATVLCAAAFGFGTWDRLHMYHPKRENISYFLTNYNPKKVIDPFRSEDTYSYGGGTGQSAGTEFVTDTGEFDWQIAMLADRKESLMSALADDVGAQLKADGAQILSRGGDLRSGLRLEYALPNYIGAVVVSPVTRDKGMVRNRPLPTCMEDALVTISVQEEWFPKGAPNYPRLVSMHLLA